MTGSPSHPEQSLWRRFFSDSTASDGSDPVSKPSKWSLGILNDKKTIEVPGQYAYRTRSFEY